MTYRKQLAQYKEHDQSAVNALCIVVIRNLRLIKQAESCHLFHFSEIIISSSMCS